MPAPTPGCIIMFSTADWNTPYWTNKQHIAQRLAQRGAQVLYIESPGLRPPRISTRDFRRILIRLGRAFTPIRKVTENLWVFSPLNIPAGHRFAAVRALNGYFMRRILRRWFIEHGKSAPLIWTYHPYFEDAIRGLPTRSIVYHCVDDLASVPGVDSAAFTRAETQLLHKADCIFTTSPRLQSHCATIAGNRSVYERNVADIEHFAAARDIRDAPADLAGIPHPRLVYAGVLSDYKLDLAFIEECVRARSDVHWIFIGDEPEGYSNPIISRLKETQNAHFLGYRPYAKLPAYLAAADIAILPMLCSGHMASVFPMKFYEYLAAGKPILATRIPALRDVRDLVYTASSVNEWLTATDTIQASPPAPISMEDTRLTRFSWEARLDRMLTRLSEAKFDT